MSEQFKPPETPKRIETPEQTMERLRPIFQESLDILNNPERDLREGLLTVSRRRPDGSIEMIPSLIVQEMTEDGPVMMGIDFVDGEPEPTAGAMLLWQEIVDAIKENG